MSERPVAVRHVVNYPHRQNKYVEDVCDREVPQEDVRWQSALLVNEGPEGQGVPRDGKDENQDVEYRKYHIPAMGFEEIIPSDVHCCRRVNLRQQNYK